MELQIKNRSYKNYRVNILKFNKYKFSLVHLISIEQAGHCLEYNNCWIAHYLCKICPHGNFITLAPFYKST
jgi:hypothetical protein